MIGGTVIETITLEDRVWINCRGERGESSTTCAIFVKKTAKSRSVSEGDAVWWQSGLAMWTPSFNRVKTCTHKHHFSCLKCGKDYDIKLERVGYSGVARPVGITATA
jgi:hypothetical protein